MKPLRKWNGKDRSFRFVIRGKSDSDKSVMHSTVLHAGHNFGKKTLYFEEYHEESFAIVGLADAARIVNLRIEVMCMC